MKFCAADEEDFLLQIFPGDEELKAEDINFGRTIDAAMNMEGDLGTNFELDYSFISYDAPSLLEPITMRQLVRKGIAHQVWPAAIILCKYIEDNRKSIFPEFPGSLVIELGAGTGLTGLYCSRIGCENVYITDLPEAIENMSFNISNNNLVNRVHAKVLRWGVAEDVQDMNMIISNHLRKSSSNSCVVLATDCLYWEQLFTPFFNTIISLLEFDSDLDKKECSTNDTVNCRCENKVNAPVIYLTYVRRWKKINKFFKMFHKYPNITVTVLKEDIEWVEDEQTKQRIRVISRICSITKCVNQSNSRS